MAEAAEAASDFNREIDAAYVIIEAQEAALADAVRDSDIGAIRLGHRVLDAVYNLNRIAYYAAYTRLNGRE